MTHHANRSHLNLKLHAWLRYISYTRFEIYCLCFSFLLIHYKLLLLGLKAAISSQFQIGLILRRLLQNLSFLHNHCSTINDFNSYSLFFEQYQFLAVKAA